MDANCVTTIEYQKCFSTQTNTNQIEWNLKKKRKNGEKNWSTWTNTIFWWKRQSAADMVRAPHNRNSLKAPYHVVCLFVVRLLLSLLNSVSSLDAIVIKKNIVELLFDVLLLYLISFPISNSIRLSASTAHVLSFL